MHLHIIITIKEKQFSNVTNSLDMEQENKETDKHKQQQNETFFIQLCSQHVTIPNKPMRPNLIILKKSRVRVCTCVSVYVCVYVYSRVFLCAHVRVFVSVFVSVCVGIYVCEVCMFVYPRVCISIYIHTHSKT